MKKIILVISLIVFSVAAYFIFLIKQPTLSEVIEQNGDGVIEKVIFKRYTSNGIMITEIEENEIINQLLNYDIQLRKINDPSHRDEEYIMALQFKNGDYAHEYLISEKYILLRDALETHNMYEVIDVNYIYEYIQSNDFEWVYEQKQ